MPVVFIQFYSYIYILLHNLSYSCVNSYKTGHRGPHSIFLNRIIPNHVQISLAVSKNRKANKIYKHTIIHFYRYNLFQLFTINYYYSISIKINFGLFINHLAQQFSKTNGQICTWFD